MIRNTARAIIINNGKILLNKNQNTCGEFSWGMPDGAVYYDLPGGGQDKYETLEDAVKRELLEEAGCIVEVGRLAAIYEDICICIDVPNEKLRPIIEAHSHKTHFVFICRLVSQGKPTALEKDMDMLESVWIDVTEIKNTPLFPQIMRDKFDLIMNTQGTMFLGSSVMRL